jgi:hypothetical protein
MIYICIVNESEKKIEFKESYPNPRDIADPKERETARLIYEQNAKRLYNETVLRNGASVDSEGRYYTVGPWEYKESTEKQFAFTS